MSHCECNDLLSFLKNWRTSDYIYTSIVQNFHMGQTTQLSYINSPSVSWLILQTKLVRSDGSSFRRSFCGLVAKGACDISYFLCLFWSAHACQPLPTFCFQVALNRFNNLGMHWIRIFQDTLCRFDYLGRTVCVNPTLKNARIELQSWSKLVETLNTFSTNQETRS